MTVITVDCAVGQDTAQIAPPSLEKSASLPPKPQSASTSPDRQTSDPDRDRVLLKEVKGIILTSDPEAVENRPEPIAGLTIQDQDLFVPNEVALFAESYIDKPLTFARLQELARGMVLAYREAGTPVVDVAIPEQDITEGILQFIIVIGKLGEITVEGAQYFDQGQYIDALTLSLGDVIQSTPIVEDLRFLNRNPYRQVDLVFSSGEEFGETNILLRVSEERPWNVFFGYRDTGNTFIGRDRVFAGFQAGNLFGQEHVLSYQYITTPDFDLIHAHAATYYIPIGNRNELRLLAAYVDTEGTSGSLDETLRIGGESVQISPSLLIPLKAYGNFVHELLIGADFKSSNNNLEFGGIDIFDQTTEIYQFSLNHIGELRSRLGYTRISNGLYFAPGELSNHNDDVIFADNRFEGSADYFYWKGSVLHAMPLPAGFGLTMEVEGQASTQNLLPSEQLLLAGIDTVRGFEQNLVRADQGVVTNIELFAPPFRLLGSLFPNQPPVATISDDGKAPVVDPITNEPLINDTGRIFGFFDYGWGRNVNLLQGEGDFSLAAAGVGFDYRIKKSLSARFAYAWQIGESGFDDGETGRWHISTLFQF